MPNSPPPPIIGFDTYKCRQRVIATRSSWRNTPLPPSRERMEGIIAITGSELEHLILGVVPRGMDERWFVFCENDQAFFHRSWTGACICEAKVRMTTGGAELHDIWFNREPGEYASTDLKHDETLLRTLIQGLFGSQQDRS